MKKIFSFTSMALFGLLVIFLFCRVDCSDNTKDNPEEPDLCGEIRVQQITFWNETFEPPETSLPLDPVEHFYIQEDGWAYYNYSPPYSYENVCAHKHIKGLLWIEINNDFFNQVKYKAEVAYGILFTYPVESWKVSFYAETTTASAMYEFGIKNVYGDDPGWFLPVITIAVEYQGDDNLTHQFFEKAIKYTFLESTYYDWKDNSD